MPPPRGIDAILDLRGAASQKPSPQIAGALWLDSNPGLTNLQGLEGLYDIGWNLYIKNNQRVSLIARRCARAGVNASPCSRLAAAAASHAARSATPTPSP